MDPYVSFAHVYEGYEIVCVNYRISFDRYADIRG